LTTNPIITANESNGSAGKSDEKMEVDVQSQSITKRKLLSQVNEVIK
jgi:hypothetical protein